MPVIGLVNFVVGVAYFMIGFVILLQYLQYRYLSQLNIVKSLWLLALFGMLQAVYAWMDFFLHAPGTTGWWPSEVSILHVLVGAASYAFFYIYGIQLLAATDRRYAGWRPTAVLLLGLWTAIFVTARLYYADPAVWLDTSRAWATYLLALPGSLLLALAFSTQIRQFKGLGLPFLTYNLYGAIVSLATFASLTLLRLPYSPMAVLFGGMGGTGGGAADSVLQVLAAGCGLALSYFILRIMQIFDLENCRRLQDAKKEQAVLAERLRISRDLHDGVIQSLYGIGLGLEHCAREMDPASPAAGQIQQALHGLEMTVEQIRQYIMDLSMPDPATSTLAQAVQSVCREFSRRSGLPVDFRWLGRLEEGTVAAEVIHELRHIVQEGLANIARHARATRAEVRIEVGPDGIVCEVEDDGVGLPRVLPPAGHGLKNIRARVKDLGGQVSWLPGPWGGTQMRVVLPWKDELKGDGRYATAADC